MIPNASPQLVLATELLPAGSSSPLGLMAHDRSTSSSLLFIDRGVANYQTLVAGVAPGTEVYLLDNTQNAISQITQTLLGRSGINSLQIVSHGQAGSLLLGDDWVKSSDLNQHAAEVQAWAQSLTADADILLYGCNVAQGELGQAFVQILSQLTGADVAASDDLTGSATLGGNWTLEVQTGSIETGLALTTTATLSYGGVLEDAVYANVQQFISGSVWAQKVFADSAGNIYTTGSFEGTVDFDPGVGTANLTSAGRHDIFISKLDRNGNYLWVKQLGGAGDDSVSGISVDSVGNVYTTGTFNRSKTYPISQTDGTNPVNVLDPTIFINKLDSNGNFLWTQQFSSISDYTPSSISVDSTGNVYTTGTFNGTVDFDPGIGTASLTSTGYNYDVFISKLDSGGNYLWAKQLGGTGYDASSGVSVDSTGNVYTLGTFSGTADFDPGTGIANLTSVGGQESFISKLDRNGNYLWVKQLGVINASGISADNAGSVYTTGSFYGTVDFDPGANTVNLSSVGESDIFINKLDSNGNYLWVKQIGGNDNEAASAISVDNAGNVYTAGTFTGTVDFNPGADAANLTSVRGQSLFINKLDSSGDYLWAKQIGGNGYYYASSINVDSAGNVYTTGNFDGAADFDPGVGIVNLLTGGASNGFLSKLDSSGNYELAQQFTSSSAVAQKVITDNAGNVYTTGYFTGTVDFDLGPGIASLTSAGERDLFISKQDSRGNHLWAKRLGGTDDEFVNGISLDNAGNVYTIGYFYGTTDFDPSASTANLTSVGQYDIFISKLDSNGNYLWAKQFGSVSDDSFKGFHVNIGGNFHTANSVSGISVDITGNVYTTGVFYGTTDFDPSPSIANLTSPGRYTIFISKLDSSGNYLWAKQLSGSNENSVSGISVDSTGSVYTTGLFTGTTDFDPGAGIANLASGAGQSDIFISKLDSSGNYLWAKQLGGSTRVYARSIRLDSANNVYTTGSFYGVADFDPGAGIANLISAGQSDIFISKLDSSGNYLWAKQLGGSSDDSVSDLSVDSTGNVYLTGSLYGTADFAPGAGIANLKSLGHSDIFISKLSSSGNYLWAKQLGGTGDDQANSISLDSAGNVYTTGTFYGKGDFDPGVGIVKLFAGEASLSFGGQVSNSFISKLSQTEADYVNTDTIGQLDFTGDRKADLLWRNQTTGEIGIWAMDGSTVIATFSLTTLDSNWRIETVADFDGNGQGDILWRNVDTQALAIWRMNGPTIAAGAYLPTLDRAWEIAGSGDFNGDGKTDLVLRHQTTGANAVWTIDGTNLTSGYYLTPVADLDWQITDVGDFNGDGKADLLWHHNATHQTAIWQLNGAILLHGDLLAPGVGWTVESTSDLNGDGKADLIWRNDSTGEMAVWLMNGAIATQMAYLPSVANLDWQIVGTGDFDRNGKADLLWRNYNSGELAIWSMDGLILEGGYVVATLNDFSWEIAGTDTIPVYTK
jgi:Domain of unknown function (DUF4347)/Beta-propeller repeat/FG-GAP-like repeat